MAKPKPLPMPVELVLMHKTMFYCAGATYRAVTTISMAYWLAGCPPEPLDDVALQNLARVPPSHWHTSRMAVKAILADILPALAREYQHAKTKRDTYIQVHRIAGQKSAAKRYATKLALQPSDQPDRKPAIKRLITPHAKPMHDNDGKMHQTVSELVAIGRKKHDNIALLRDE